MDNAHKYCFELWPIKDLEKDIKSHSWWDGTEVWPVKRDQHGLEHMCEDEETPDYWCVYIHTTRGGIIDVANVATEDEASSLAKLIELLAKTYTP